MTFDLTLTEQNLILTGYIGPNQPLMGRQIAEQLRLPFVDVDLEIANRAELSVDEIRDYFGETHLKVIEADIVHEASLRRGTVVRVSGRILLNGDHLARLRSTGPVVCLTTDLGEMLRRLHVNMGAQYHDPQERAAALAELKRDWAVRDVEGIHRIDATTMTNQEIVDQVVSLWRELSIRRV